ncbi:unnamed protein product [Owenia fusiformis]|uniref:VWFA domain-containing protein n=1 Tax=Owenia fusiformis TaxID=6347 RepID=A0A8S4N0D6_OWEFU|nr:unnamed protein product [Owenia fusiformis]
MPENWTVQNFTIVIRGNCRNTDTLEMGTYIFHALAMLVCALGTDARLTKAFNRLGQFTFSDVLNDMSDRGVECTSGTRYKYAETSCSYLECFDSKYELVRCPDGQGVSDKFENTLTSQTLPCSKPLPYCRLSLAEKGLPISVTEVCGIDLNFVVDMSFSISDVNKMKVRSFILNLVKKLKLGPAFTLLSGSTYGASTHSFLEFSTYNAGSSMIKAIKNMETLPKKGTSTYLALKEAREVHLTTSKGRRKDKKAVVMVMTDGVTNPLDKSPTTIAEAKRLKDPKSYEPGVSAPTVVLLVLPNSKGEKGRGVSRAELEKLRVTREKEFAAIPSEGKENRYNLDSFDQLEEVINPILQSSCKAVE